MDDASCPLQHYPHIPNAHICFKAPQGTHGHIHVCDEHAEAVREFVKLHPKAGGKGWTEVNLRVPVTEPRLPECQAQR